MRVAEFFAKPPVARKPVNRYTSNEFHDWQRIRLDPRFVIQDIDAWALVAADDRGPAALFELKRSSIAVTAWKPFAADRPNYAALLALANAASLPLYVVYFVGGQPITDDSLLGVFLLQQAEPEYHGVHRVMEAAKFAERFPFPISKL